MRFSHFYLFTKKNKYPDARPPYSVAAYDMHGSVQCNYSLISLERPRTNKYEELLPLQHEALPESLPDVKLIFICFVFLARIILPKINISIVNVGLKTTKHLNLS